MSGFPPTCFHREPRNLRACTKAPAAVASALAVLPALTIVDLACDTGAMLRALAPHLPALQNGNSSTTTSICWCVLPTCSIPRPE